MRLQKGTQFIYIYIYDAICQDEISQPYYCLPFYMKIYICSQESYFATFLAR